MVLSILLLTTCPVSVRTLLRSLVVSVLMPCLQRAWPAAPSWPPQCSCGPCRTDRVSRPGRSHAAAAVRTVPCAATASRCAARSPIFCAVHWLSSAHLSLHETRRYGQLGAGQPKGFTCDLLADPFHLEQHLAGLDLGDPILDVALAAAHAHFERLLGDRHVRKYADPDRAAALDVARHSAARRLDLTRRHARPIGRLEPEIAERHGIAAQRQAAVVALELLAVLGSLWLQHDSLLTLSPGLARLRGRHRRRGRHRGCSGD